MAHEQVSSKTFLKASNMTLNIVRIIQKILLLTF